MSALRWTYLALALAGAAVPMWHLVPWIVRNGLSVDGLIAAWTQNAAATGLFWDLVISAVALSVWILAEVSIRRNWRALWAIPATFLIGVSCGLPLYLFLRSRPI
ncbi:DUF2834 domain-containing protein [Thalassobius sp. S69A]|uniref:DUF2834 domain-containing protein n=1 Tax=unclassified Thalassovita TaxID=2619711 RepID=UPI000C0E18CC|nr:K+-transporting ATPase, A chain [Paracoccaceae bacterium]MBT25223.1 K+-transporting ATPase, A chain [Paracoccaceae bacterium]|tara:strand:- start:152 stop:466 length:315 start_codon:yes stop_codon:yes gene_type:complete